MPQVIHVRVIPFNIVGHSPYSLGKRCSRVFKPCLEKPAIIAAYSMPSFRIAIILCIIINFIRRLLNNLQSNNADTFLLFNLKRSLIVKQVCEEIIGVLPQLFHSSLMAINIILDLPSNLINNSLYSLCATFFVFNFLRCILPAICRVKKQIF